MNQTQFKSTGILIHSRQKVETPNSHQEVKERQTNCGPSTQHSIILPWWLRRQRIHLQCRTPRFNPWVGRSPGEGSDSRHQYSCLENPMDKEDWWATVHRVSKGSDTTW